MLPLPSFLKADSLKSAAAKVSGSFRLPKIPDDNRTMMAETARNVGKFVHEKPFAAIFVASLAVHGLIWATLPNPFASQTQTQNSSTPKPSATPDPSKLPVVTLPQTNTRSLNRRRLNRGNPLAGLPFLNNLPNILNPNAPKSGVNIGLNGNATTVTNGLPTIAGSNGFSLDQMPPSGGYPTGLPLNLGDLGQLPPIEASRDDGLNNPVSNAAPRSNRIIATSPNNGTGNNSGNSFGNNLGNNSSSGDNPKEPTNLIDNRVDNRSSSRMNRPNNSNLRPDIDPNAINGSDTFFTDDNGTPPPRKNSVSQPAAQSPVITPLVNTSPLNAPVTDNGNGVANGNTPAEEVISSWDVLYANLSSQLNNQVILRQIATKEEQVANVEVEPVNWIPVANAPKGKKGVVEVALLISPEGKVKRQFLKSSGDEQLDNLVRQTIKGYYDKFQPLTGKTTDDKSAPKHRLIRIRYLFS